MYLREGASFYQGDMRAPEVFKEALDQSRLRTLVAAGPTRDKPSGVPVDLLASSPATVRLWEDGVYEVHGFGGAAMNVSVSGAGHLGTIEGPWDIRFPPGLGAPAHVTLAALQPLHLHPDPRVRYFSGTANWNTTFEAPRRTSSVRVCIDLGDVEATRACA